MCHRLRNPNSFGASGHGDPLSADERSKRMSSVRNKGNRSTEQAVASRLLEVRVRRWVSNDRSLPGCPDFHFPREHIAVFVDGCFWHGCPTCKRRMPRNNREFWLEKIKGTRRRDERLRRLLRRNGYSVLRVWEHEIVRGAWLRRLLRKLQERSLA
jgi:DNA mismatch endonuclease (patch repair protein)